MIGFTFAVTCPHCGCSLEPLARGKSTGRQTSAMVRCTGCLAEQQVMVTMVQTLSPRRKVA